MENILKQQLRLSRKANISITESGNMSFLDFNLYYDILVADINKENEQYK